MPVTKLQVTFESVHVLDSSDTLGPGNWHFEAKVDGKTVGDPDQEFVAEEGEWISLGPTALWSTTLDLSNKRQCDSIEIRFSGYDEDVLDDDDLGQVTVVLKYPFKQELTRPIPSSIVEGGWFSSDTRFYELKITTKILEEKATLSGPGPGGLFVNRQAAGTETFSTLSGTSVTPRVEICPVVPVPSVDVLPKRPEFPASLMAGRITIAALAATLSSSAPWNLLPNPAVIPILSPSDPNRTNKAARVAVTYIEPGNLDTSYFTWVIKSGPVAFLGETAGKEEVRVYGTATGNEDQEAIIELRWDGETGPLLSTFRAWVGKPKQIPYRALIVNPSKESMKIRSTAADVANQIQMAQPLLWHAGLFLVPDTDTTAWDGATYADNGVFEVTLPAAKDNWTIGVNYELTQPATRMNFRPGVMHLCYIKSAPNIVGAATDCPGLSGNTETDRGSPSASWVSPSGVPPDDAAGAAVMKTLGKITRGTSASDKAYLKARSLPADAMDQLYGLIMPDYTTPDNVDWGQTLAHEVGHVLGLRHRGNGGLKEAVGPSQDGINDPTGRGYPWRENVMCYGFASSQDFDTLQAAVMRRHPVLV